MTAVKTISPSASPDIERYRARVLEHASTRLRGLESIEPAEISRRLRSFLKIEDARLKIAIRCGASGFWTTQARTLVLDILVEHAFRATLTSGDGDEYLAKVQNSCALVAIGGYGRGELAPFSDIDLLILHNARRTTQMKQLAE